MVIKICNIHGLGYIERKKNDAGEILSCCPMCKKRGVSDYRRGRTDKSRGAHEWIWDIAVNLTRAQARVLQLEKEDRERWLR